MNLQANRPTGYATRYEPTRYEPTGYATRYEPTRYEPTRYVSL
jgi:hypothetical protein